jgi:hypothetical protein
MFSMGREEQEGISLGARIAGVVLVLNALSILYAAIAFNLSATARTSSAAVDAILGALLVLGMRRVIPFCIFRVVVGGVVYLGMSLYGGDVVSGVMQVAFSASLLGLLLGTPGLPRTGLSAAAASGCLLVTAFLLYSGTRVRSSEALLASSEIEVIGEEGVRGRSLAYRLSPPNDRWFLRSEQVTTRDNPMADRWLVRPDRDAHFLVIAERFPGGQAVDVGVYEQAVLENLRNAAVSIQILEQGALWEHYAQSRYVHARALVTGVSIDYAYGIVVFQDQGYQLIGFASEREYPAVAAEIRQILDSVVIGER